MSDESEREECGSEFYLFEDFQRLMLFVLLIKDKVGSLPEKVQEVIDRYPDLRDHLEPSVREVEELERQERSE